MSLSSTIHNFIKKISLLVSCFTFIISILLPFSQPVVVDAATNCSAGNQISLKGLVMDGGAGRRQGVSLKNDLGLNSVRTWKSINSWDNLPTASFFSEEKEYKQMGYKVLTVFSIPEGNGGNRGLPDPNKVKAWFSAAYNAGHSYVDYWELQNEPNLSNYWPYSLQQYMTNFHKPAWQGLKSASNNSAFVVSGAISWNPDAVKILVDLGVLNMTDAVGFHPYGDNGGKAGKISQHISAVTKVHDMIGGKQLFITEWNIHGLKNGDNISNQDWASSLTDIYNGDKGCVNGVWYFGSDVLNTMAGPAGLLKSDGSKNEPFYSGLKKAYTGAAVSTPPVASPSPTKSPSPSPTKSPTTGGGSGGIITGGGSGGTVTGGGTSNPGTGSGSTPIPTVIGSPSVKPSPSTSVSPSTTIKPSPSTTVTPNPSSPTGVTLPSGTTSTSNQPIVSINNGQEPTPAGLVPCTGVSINGGTECNYQTFIKLIQNVLNFMFLITGFIIILMILWQGYGFLTSQGNPEKIKKLKKSLWKTILGFIIVISSWLVVSVVANALINKNAGYINPLDSSTSQNNAKSNQ